MIEPIVIKVIDKVPIVVSGPPYVVCDNSDYAVVWQLDEEWAQFEHRTMQVNYKDGTYERVLFTGDSCTLPAIPVSGPVHVGLFAGDIHTTRPARLLAVRSATTDSGEERAPMPDGYAQAIKALDGKLDKDQGKENAGKALVVDKEGNVAPGEAQGGSSLPVASPTQLGGVKPVAKTDAMTKNVGVDASGGLWTEPTAGETWEKIAEIELRADTAEYVLADFATWRKAKVIMVRPQYIGGLNKNVWCKVVGSDLEDTYSCGYLGTGYGYIFWEFFAEVNELFITTEALESNNVQIASYVKSSGTFTPLKSPVGIYKFELIFVDTSVIQAGDKVTVIGVRR